jgi:(E)-4-hydroxy-3-methylbut-2-enyl-diphosphate synthase
VRVGYEILKALGLRKRGLDLHVCPTCGRTEIDLASIADAVRRELADWAEPVSVALMGCVVNGPGEVKHTDVGLVGGAGVGAIYVRGERVDQGIPESQLAERVVETVRAFVAEGGLHDG